jgi:hypothetical protein
MLARQNCRGGPTDALLEPKHQIDFATAHENRCYVRLPLHDRQDRDRDIRPKVSAAGNGFSGANPSAWFSRIEINRFITDLRALDESREGSATLETMSPGECVLKFRNFDKLGHLHLEVAIARAVYYFGETDHFRCRIRFEVDPTAFPSMVDELASELGDSRDRNWFGRTRV